MISNQVRHAAMQSVLDHVQHHPYSGRPLESLPTVRAAYGDRSTLMQELQWLWARALWTRIEVLTAARGTRPADVAVEAWADCAALMPSLRRLLDAERTDHVELRPPGDFASALPAA